MPTDLSLNLGLNGASTVKGTIGPRDFPRQLKQLGQFHELEVQVLPGDIFGTKIIPLPPIASPKFLFLQTDLPVLFQKTGEVVQHSLDTGGMHLEIGSLAVLASIAFQAGGSPQSNIYIAFGG